MQNSSRPDRKRPISKRAGRHILIRLYLLGMILLVTTPSFANSNKNAELILIRAPGLELDEFNAYAEAHGYESLSDALDSRRPDSQMKSHLRSSIEKAQSAWLSGSLGEARSEFQKVFKMALQADWRESEREAIHYSLLRLAQSAGTPFEKDEWLTRAASMFNDIPPDSKLFPPPLLNAYNEKLSEIRKNSQVFSPYLLFPDHQTLLINGKSYKITPDLQVVLPPGPHRLTALSDSHPPMTEVLNSAQVSVFQARVEPLAAGKCETPFMSPKIEETVSGLKQVAVLYPQDCLLKYRNGRWVQGDQTINVEALMPDRILDSSLGRPLKGSLGDFRGPLASNHHATSEVRKRWLWFGVSVLAAGAAYSLYRELNRERPTETHYIPAERQGF